MRYLRILLFLILHWASNVNLHAMSCCEFEFYPITKSIVLPSSLHPAPCEDKEPCDPKYLIAAKMVHSVQTAKNDSVGPYFKELIPFLREDEVDDFSLNVVYTYAKFLEEDGKGEQASFYYSWLIKRSGEKLTTNLLSRMAIASIFSNVKEIEKLSKEVEQVVLSNQVEDPNDKIGLVCWMTSILPHEERYDFSRRFKSLKNEAASPENMQALLISFSYSFSKFPDEYYTEVNEELKKYFKNQRDDRFLVDEYICMSEKALAERNYTDAIAYTKKAIDFNYGKVESLEELIRLAKSYKKGDVRLISRLAHYNLYQTRQGKGLRPVKESFKLYYGVDNIVLERKRSEFSGLSSRKIDLLEYEFIAILVVGTYLYQKTGEVEYLDKSISVADNFQGFGTHYWLSIRDEIRRNNDFREVMKVLEKNNQLNIVLGENYELDKLYEEIEKYNEARKNIPKAYADFMSSANQEDFSLQKKQSQVAQDSSAILSFYQSGKALYRLLVTEDTIMISQLNEISAEVVKLSTGILKETWELAPEQQSVRNSRRLFQVLFGDIKHLLPKRVSIIAGGVLTEIPFSALRMDGEGEAPSYFGVEHAISRQFSIRSKQMLEEAELRPKYAQPLAMAPAFRSEWLLAGELRQAGFVIPPLKYNQEEVEKLSDLSGGRFLTGEGATVANYKKYAKDYGIIHLATHAISSEEDGLKSHVLLLDENGSPEPLYASEIGDETLNADLVVLSACETGGGLLHAAEGTVGLTKAYLAAGARAVVASSWAVDDHATAELMNSFYEALAGGSRPDDALRDARAAYLQKYPNATPDKWAAFEAYGGMKAPDWDKSQNPFKGIWIWLLAGLGLIAGVLMLRKMKYA